MKTAKLGPGNRWVSLIAVVLVAFAPCAFACRIIFPPPWPPHPPHPPMPRPRPVPQWAPMEVRSHKATVDIRRHVATVSVDAVFYNPNPSQIEGTYLFPIGRNAAVSSFAMTVNGKTLEAQLLDAKEARQTYEEIVRQMRDPALLEYLDQGLLKARVFPIEPHKEVAIHLTYEEMVDRQGGMNRLVYPLLSARPDGNRKIKELLLDVTIHSDIPLKNVFSPGFSCDVRRDNDTTARLTFEARDFEPDKDFAVLYSESEARIGVDFLGYRDGDEGYFLILASPNSELQGERIPTKEVTFVIDTSGSMSGDKIRQAKEALTFCINSLRDGDRFNIISFSTDVVPLFDGPRTVGEAERRQALDFVAGLHARGGTAIDQALRSALSAAATKDLVSMVVFITDGLPTVGETDVAAILKNVGGVVERRRVFSLGVGYDVNTRLLDGMSRATRGSSDYVRPEENLEIALGSFYGKIEYPVLTDLQLGSGGRKLERLNPPDLPDLFKGGRLLVTGQYRGKGNEEMVLSGMVGDTREKFVFKADLDGDARNAFVPRMWAISRVAYLREQIAVNGANKELTDEIRELGRRYGILTDETSFLVLEEGMRDRFAGGRPIRESEVRMRLHGNRGGGPGMMGSGGGFMAPESGRSAVERSLALDAMKGGQGYAAPAESAEAFGMDLAGVGMEAKDIAVLVKPAHDKTFYLRPAEGVYYDSLIPKDTSPDADIEVEAWSEAFVTLLRKYPALAKYMTVGDKLVVVLDGKTIRITAPKDE